MKVERTCCLDLLRMQITGTACMPNSRPHLRTHSQFTQVMVMNAAVNVIRSTRTSNRPRGTSKHQ